MAQDRRRDAVVYQGPKGKEIVSRKGLSKLVKSVDLVPCRELQQHGAADHRSFTELGP
jgi:hypothetical protein